MLIPKSIKTKRLLLRCWKPDDADKLLPILKSNINYLKNWIPERIWKPVPLNQLRKRLEGFISDFDSRQVWRFAIYTLKDGVLIGEVSFIPRTASERVNYKFAERVEIGYWLRQDAAGNGFATEASEAMMKLASLMKRFTKVEIHHDSDNLPSSGIPKRLGFKLSRRKSKKNPGDMIWYYNLPYRSSSK